ncbi:MAG TPA: hypothetical protein VG028_18775 [Terriglobia bacterium]|nr:hypothetical protein [Terriglobia bacterium]
MHTTKHAIILSCSLLVLFLAGGGPGYSRSAVVGIIVSGTGIKVSGYAVPSNTALFSGDEVQVSDRGTAVIKLAHGGVLVLSKQTTASFHQQGDSITVGLSQGRISVAQPRAGTPMEVSAEGIRVEPERGAEATGHIIFSHGKLSVTSTEGNLRIEGQDVAAEAASGMRVTLNRVPSNEASAASGVRWVVYQRHANNKTADDSDDNGKNPTAISHVAAHVPPAACEHAASPSVPAVACHENGEGE